METGGTWSYVDIIGGYFHAGSEDDPGSYFLIDELVIDDGYIGPPTGFLDGDPVNGACGSNDGATISGLTSGNANNCSAGTVADFSGTGPWTWNCDGSNGGTDDSCEASLASQVAGALRQGAFRVGGSPARFVETTP
jgi:hypothetical protein